MVQRIIVALVLIPLFLLFILLGDLWSVGLFLVMGLAGAYEFYRMLARQDYHPATGIGILWTGALILHGWQPGRLPLDVLLPLGFIVTFIYSLYETEQPLRTVLGTSTVAVYLGVMIGDMVALRLLPTGLWWLLLALVITWGSDTTAYFVGVSMGRHKIWPRLSPKKSWEGTIGGLIGGAAAGGLAAVYFPLPIGVGYGAAIGLIGAALGFFGDLSISMVKRQVGVKDSGRLLPGHGGMLDRLDSLLFVVPFVYFIAQYWVQR